MDIKLAPKVLKLNTGKYHTLTNEDKKIFVQLVKMCNGDIVEATHILTDDLSITTEEINTYCEDNKMFKIKHGNYNVESKKVSNKQKANDKTLLIEKIVDFIVGLNMVTNITIPNKNREILFQYNNTSYSLVLAKKNKK